MQISPLSTQTTLVNPLISQEPHEIKKQEEREKFQAIDKDQKRHEIKKIDGNKEDSKEGYEIAQSRETYGLMVLELMDDMEYQAFERATVGMTRGEKMIAAQSLYRLSELQKKHANASFPEEQNSGYARTINFGDKFARALYFGEQHIDIMS